MLERQTQFGYSLLELTIVLALVGVVASGVMVGLTDLQRQQQRQLMSQQLTHVLQVARQYALALQTRIWVCASDDQKHCGGDWCAGQLITTQAGVVLAVFSGFSGRGRLHWQGGFAKGQMIGFQANGMTLGQQGHFVWRDGWRRRTQTLVKVLNGGAVVSLDAA